MLRIRREILTATGRSWRDRPSSFDSIVILRCGRRKAPLVAVGGLQCPCFNALPFQSAFGNSIMGTKAFSRAASSCLKELYQPRIVGVLGLLLLISSHCAVEASSAMAVIPEGLSQHESTVYQKLIRFVKRCKKRGESPRPVVVITDVGKDYDDLAALVVLKEFHRLGLVELRAVVANLMPADKRAHLARAALESLGLRDVPVACGTRGSPDEHEVLDHEFNGAEFCRGDSVAPEDVPQQDGQDLLREVYENAKEKGDKLYLLCLSSLQDIHEFASNHPRLVAECTAEVHMQGGNYFSKEGKLEPDSKAANNRFNLEAAVAWHSFIQTKAIPSHTYTKIAAFAAPLTSDVFVELEVTGHPIGAYLRRVQVAQDVAFYKRACESDPAKRFAPFMDQKWFLANKTNWHRRAHAQGDALPTGKEVIPYLTRIVVYDAQAALGVAGQDVVAALKVFHSRDRSIQVENSNGRLVTVQHRITGDEHSTAVPEEISLTLSTLMKGSLLILQERMALHTEQQRTKICIPRISFVRDYSPPYHSSGKKLGAFWRMRNNFSVRHYPDFPLGRQFVASCKFVTCDAQRLHPNALFWSPYTSSSSKASPIAHRKTDLEVRFGPDLHNIRCSSSRDSDGDEVLNIAIHLGYFQDLAKMPFKDINVRNEHGYYQPDICFMHLLLVGRQRPGSTVLHKSKLVCVEADYLCQVLGNAQIVSNIIIGGYWHY